MTGTGKTWRLRRLVERKCEDVGAENIIVLSFTRAAAHELVNRLIAGGDMPLEIPRHHIGTLHHFAYEAMGRPKIADAMIEQWNKDRQTLRLSGEGRISVDEPMPDGVSLTDGDELMMKAQRLRARMIPREQWAPAVARFHALWQEWCRANGYMDFTGMIEECVRSVEVCPGNPTVLIADESQDFTALELALIYKWGAQCQQLILALDDDQCQPPGTMVLTTMGYVPIEQIDPSMHRLVSYDRAKGGEVRGSRNGGYDFQIANRAYDGEMYTITVNGKLTQATEEHKWLARWNAKAHDPGTCVVYLMRQGGRFRVGWCQLFRNDGIFHLGARARLEKADAAWILKVCNGRTDASVWESIIAARYGLPTVTFEPVYGAQHLTREALDSIFSALSPDLLMERALQCLSAHDCSYWHPIWNPEKAYTQRGGTSWMEIETVNLQDGLMEIPTYVGSKEPMWDTIRISHEHYHGPVYSLDVQPYHYYIADGVITHNCIYYFKGSLPDAILNRPIPADHKHVLSQSYRVPHAVWDLAVRWITQLKQREEKTYQPRHMRDEAGRYTDDVAEGEVRRLPQASWRQIDAAVNDAEDRYLSRGKTAMFLASCSYMLDPLKAVLRKRGIPFENPYRRTRGDWNPLHPGSGTTSAERLLSYLRPNTTVWGVEESRMWTPDDLRCWTEVIAAKGTLRHGAKTKLELLVGDMPIEDITRLMPLFEEEAFNGLFDAIDDVTGAMDWFEQHLLASKRTAMDFPLQVARNASPRKLMEKPQVIIGTIHSVKGGEADAVYLMPDLSTAGMREWVNPGPFHDSIVRLMYVGITRAFESLVICEGASGAAVPLANYLSA